VELLQGQYRRGIYGKACQVKAYKGWGTSGRIQVVKLLALESSSELFTAALYLDGRIIEREGARGDSHSEIALPLVKGLLDEQKTVLADLDGIVFGAGPGAFTGLRLACSVAQGLAIGADLPVLGIGSLEALALGAGDGFVYVCTDARMREVYSAAYRVCGDSVVTIMAPVVSAPAAVPLPAGVGWLGRGSGFAAYADALAERLGAQVTSVDPDARPRADTLLRLAAPRFTRGEGFDAALAAPLYVRDKVAMTTRERIAQGGKA